MVFGGSTSSGIAQHDDLDVVDGGVLVHVIHDFQRFAALGHGPPEGYRDRRDGRRSALPGLRLVPSRVLKAAPLARQRRGHW